MKKEFESLNEKFIFGHNLITSKAPKKLTLAQLDIVEFSANTDTTKFGFFNDSSPNFNTYYPDITPEDLNPQDGDFILPIFRALSETTVRAMFPVTFAKPGVLKSSVDKLTGQTVYPNHEAIVGNELGSVLETFYEGQKKDKSGLIIPPGINARLKIDGKSNPQIARGIMMDPPSIHSTSVTVSFLWEKSHKEMSEEEFRSKMGSYDEKGLLIQRVCTKILAYHEISLVAHGADPFAQKIKEDGGINNPGYAESQKIKGNTNSLHFISYKEPEAFAASILPEPIIEQFNNPKPQRDSNQKSVTMEFIESLALALGIKPEEVKNQNEASLLLYTKNIIADLDKFKKSENDFQTQIKNLTKQVSDKDAEIALIKEYKAPFEKYLQETRDETVRLYKLSLGENKTAEESVLKLISEGNLEAVKILKDSYQAQVDKALPLSCTDCGSHNVNRLSSNPGGQNPEGNKNPKDNDTVSREFYAASKGSIFGSVKK